MRKKDCLLAFLALLWVVSGCTAFRVSTDYDPEARFDGLRTYAWMPEEKRLPTGDHRLDSPLLEKRIVKAVEETLGSMGYRRARQGTPDFFVGYHAAIRERLDVWTMNACYAYPPGWAWDHYRGGPGWVYAPRMTTYEEGTLVLDIVSAEKRQLIWRGSARAPLDDAGDTPEEREAHVAEAVRSILAHFPPGNGADQPE